MYENYDYHQSIKQLVKHWITIYYKFISIWTYILPIKYMIICKPLAIMNRITDMYKSKPIEVNCINLNVCIHVQMNCRSRICIVTLR